MDTKDVILYKRSEHGVLHKIGVLVGRAEYALTHKTYLDDLLSNYDEVRIQTLDGKGEMVYNKDNPDGFFSEYDYDDFFY